MVSYCVTARGLAAALAYDVPDPAHGNSCSTTLEESAAPLVARAARDGAVSPEVTVGDLIALIVGVTLTTERHPEPAAEASRLFRIAVAGISPQR